MPIENTCNVTCISVDGTDFRIEEPTPFSPKWFSHKFRSAAVRYEIGISLGTGHFVWVNGPFTAGSHSDQRIFNSNLRYMLLPNEKVLADQGYRGPEIVHDNLSNDRSGDLAGRYRAAHERLNGRIKVFGCLQNRFRHAITKHNLCMFAVVNIVQIELLIQ